MDTMTTAPRPSNPWHGYDPGPPRNCPDCAVEPGKNHVSGCDVERCAICDGQAISCGHDEFNSVPETVWTGWWPGELECAERNMFSHMVPGKNGWHKCGPADEGASPDLNEYTVCRALRRVDPLNNNWKLVNPLPNADKTTSTDS